MPKVRPSKKLAAPSEVQTVVTALRSVLSDQDIAEQLGCGVSTVSMWANGKRATRTGTLMFKLFRLHAEQRFEKAA